MSEGLCGVSMFVWYVGGVFIFFRLTNHQTTNDDASFQEVFQKIRVSASSVQSAGRGAYRSLGNQPTEAERQQQIAEALHADTLSQQLYDQITSNEGTDDLLWRIAKFLVANGTIQTAERRMEERRLDGATYRGL